MHRPPHFFGRASRPALFLALSSVALSACGSPPPAAAPVTIPPASGPVAAPPAAPDLTAVPEPEGLIAFARAAKPSEALKVVGGWVQLPMPGAAEVAALVTGEPFASLVDLDQPIDFALLLRGRQPRGAMSAAVKSLDDAKLALSKYKLVPGDDGALRIEGLGKPDDADKDGDEGEARVCELVPAVGATRLICAESEATLHELSPWLARTAPRTTYPADVHVELRLAPVRPLVDQMRRLLPMFAGSALGLPHTGVAEIDAAFRAGIDDFADLASDVETIALDAMIGEPQATVTLTSRFRSTTSFLARLGASHPEHAGAPPAAFWKLPADADFAFFHGGIDAADFEHPRDHLADIVGAALAKEGLGDADRKALRDATAHALDLLTLPSEYAKGLDVDAAEKAVTLAHAAEAGSNGARDEAVRVAAEKMAGWLVVGLQAPAAKVAATEKEWAVAWGRPGVVKWARAKGGDVPAPLVRMAPLPKGIAGKDAAHLEIIVSSPRLDAAGEGDGEKKGKKASPGRPLVLHALLVPDGGSSWLVFAADEALAVAKAKALVATGPNALASRPGLASMKDAKMNAGGFVSARAFTVGDVFSWTLNPPWGKLGRDPLAGIASAPDQAMTPIPVQLTTEAASAGSPAGTFVATMTVPKTAIASIVRMAMAMH
jgi:hypothetical protein